MKFSYTRRNALKKMLTGTLAVGATAAYLPACAQARDTEAKKASMGKAINHSVCRWTFAQLSLAELCQTVKEIGFAAIDLVGPAEWQVLQQQGVYCSMCNGAEISLEDGWNEPANHATLLKNYS